MDVFSSIISVTDSKNLVRCESRVFEPFPVARSTEFVGVTSKEIEDVNKSRIGHKYFQKSR